MNTRKEKVIKLLKDDSLCLGKIAEMTGYSIASVSRFYKESSNGTRKSDPRTKNRQQEIIEIYKKLEKNKKVISCYSIAKEMYGKANYDNINLIVYAIDKLKETGQWSYEDIPRVTDKERKRPESNTRKEVKRLGKNKNLTLTEIARIVGVSIVRVHQIYREEFGNNENLYTRSSREGKSRKTIRRIIQNSKEIDITAISKKLDISYSRAWKIYKSEIERLNDRVITTNTD